VLVCHSYSEFATQKYITLVSGALDSILDNKLSVKGLKGSPFSQIQLVEWKFLFSKINLDMPSIISKVSVPPKKYISLGH
jgi:hypothetical protein